MLLLGPSGCGAAVAPATIFEEDDPRAGAAPEIAAPAFEAPVARPSVDDAAAANSRAPIERLIERPIERPIAPPGIGRRTGIIERATLLHVLDAGPGSLLRTIEVSPWFEGSRFLGWRLDQIVDAASPVADVDLVVGDIIVAINQRPIARPEHVMAIWKELRDADELVCQVWRGQAALDLRFSITPRAAAIPAPAAKR
jgi:hypothetical protein